MGFGRDEDGGSMPGDGRRVVKVAASVASPNGTLAARYENTFAIVSVQRRVFRFGVQGEGQGSFDFKSPTI